eukprot:SAG11_NODE_924_length_6525_cov_5.604264_9_plen_72_part_00
MGQAWETGSQGIRFSAFPPKTTFVWKPVRDRMPRVLNTGQVHTVMMMMMMMVYIRPSKGTPLRHSLLKQAP